jgi:hypothetical protein
MVFQVHVLVDSIIVELFIVQSLLDGFQVVGIVKDVENPHGHLDVLAIEGSTDNRYGNGTLNLLNYV